jgi:anti-anti-sigma factor
MKMQSSAGGFARVRLPAVIDEHAADALRVKLRTLAADPSVACLELDATELRYVGGRGLGLLASVGLIARGRGARTYVVNCRPRLLALMRASRLTAVVGEPPEAELRESDADWTPWWTSAAANA